MRKRTAVVVGWPYYAKFLARLMNEHSTWRFKAFGTSRTDFIRALFALRRADALVAFGGPAPAPAFAEAARRANIPVIVVWGGFDVIKAQKDPLNLELIKQQHFTNVSDGPWLVEELAELGVRAEYLPLTAVRDGGPIKPFPRRFRVLTYLPEPQRDFYGAPAVYDIARAMPDVPFIVAGHGVNDPSAPTNVRFCGLVNDMQDRIDDCTVLLRLPKHDGKSMLVLEALARARHVVWNYEFPTVTTVKSSEEALVQLQRLRDLHDAGKLELNHEGRAFALQNFARADIAQRFESRLESAIRERAGRIRNPLRRVGICGLPLFCAEVAQYTYEFLPEWEPHLLTSTSRREIIISMLRLASCDVWYTIGGPITCRWFHWTARLLRKPHVIHWVGSDITKLQADPHILRAVQEPRTTHLAEVDWTAEELRTFGLEARIAPLPPRHRSACVKPLPERFTILLYIPRTRANFYGTRELLQLMERLRGEDVRYIIVGGGSIDAPPGIDVENLGWRHQLEDVYERASVLIRYTVRDGLSLMVLEALTFGRHVLWTQTFPYTRRIRSYADMEREIRSLLEAHKAGTLKPQTQASQALLVQYSPKLCMLEIAAAWSRSADVDVKPKLAMEAS